MRFSLSFTLIAILAFHVGAIKSGRKCRQLGYSNSLLCSSCDLLAEHVQDEEIVSECRACCRKGSQSEPIVSATLQYCNCNLGRFREVQDFVQTKASRFPSLRLEHVQGQLPQLLLRTASGVTKDPVKLMEWKSDTIIEFLEQKLGKAAEE